MAVSTIKAGSAGVDQSFTIATNAWSSTAPYTYTWSSDKITAGSRVTVDFYGTPAESSDVSYIEYEKVSVSNGYGIKFTSPVKPTVSISLIAHILNSKPLRLENITGADVSTSVISGAANVNEALSALNSKINIQLISGFNQDQYGYRKLVNYPTGYNASNAIIISMQYDYGNEQYRNVYSQSGVNLYATCRLDGIEIYTNSSEFAGYTWRIILYKIA